MLTPIGSDNLDQAIVLLREGFPERPHNFWESMLDRVRALGENEAAGVPLGLLLEDKATKAPVGVCLTLATRRHGEGGAALLNASAMYVRPEQRWMTTVLMRAISRMKADTILDLTPTEQVRKMLPALGYRPICQSVSVLLTPLAALTNWSGAKVLPLSAAPAGAVPAWERKLLESHAPFGCLAATLRIGETHLPLLFKLDRSVKGLPSATLLYSPDNTRLYAYVGAVARFLLSRGRAALRIDTPLDAKAPGVPRPGQAVKYAKGFIAPNRTDYAGTELALFELNPKD